MHKIEQSEKKYGLFTAFTMIVGIVIGSGIFFKSDNILVYTNGNILLGVFVFIIAAAGIIFGSLTISELEEKSTETGGLIAYANEFIGIKTACAIGWFQTFIYFPVLIAIVSFVIGVYFCMLFNLGESLELQVLIGFCYVVFSFLMNTFSAKAGGYFQNAATIIKMIPLVIIAVGGLIFIPSSNFSETVNQVHTSGSVGWIAALAPIAFTFDGWIVALSIADEVKNSKKNLPIAYTAAPIMILIVYILYFVGISFLVTPQRIIELGDAHVSVAANKLLGSFGAKIMLIFVVISVMGTVNGLVLGSIRMPHSLSCKGMFIKSAQKVSDKHNVPIISALISFIAAIIWIGAHYISQKYRFFGHSDISEGFVVISYAIYIVMYIKVILMHKKGEIKGIFKGIVFPLFGILGSLIILYAGLHNPAFYFYVIVTALVMAASVIYLKKA